MSAAASGAPPRAPSARNPGAPARGAVNTELPPRGAEGRMRYTKIFIVRWSDADVNGHMRNTSYSEYATDVRMSYLADRGWTHAHFEEAKVGPVLLREELDYFRELRLGDTVEVDVTCIGLSPDGSRFKMAHDFWRPGGKKVARVEISAGWLDLTTRRLVVPPQELRDIFAGMPRGEAFEELPVHKAKG